MSYTIGELVGDKLQQTPENPLPVVDPDKKGKNMIVSKVAYLLGVPKEKFSNNTEELAYDKAVYDEMDKEKRAKLVRALCMVRTDLEQNYAKIFIRQRSSPIRMSIMTMPDLVNKEAVMYLVNSKSIQREGELYKKFMNPQDAVEHINSLLMKRINNCRDFFPEWINWKYIANIFIMPNGQTEEGIKAAGEYYRKNYARLPFHIYINWKFGDQDTGLILHNDARFVTLLYQQNKDTFTDVSKIADVSAQTKISIQEFMEGAKKVVALVDCENSDPYALCAALDGLEEATRAKIKQIVLIDDQNTGTGWENIHKYISVPVKHVLTERVLERKSIVDMTLAIYACQEFYENNADSLILCASDSDYWPLIDKLKARYLVMVEQHKCSYELQSKFIEKGINYALIDKFYSAGSTGMQYGILVDAVTAELRQRLDISLNELITKTAEGARMTLTETEKTNFFEKYIRTLKFSITSDGRIEIVGKKPATNKSLKNKYGK